eukprot:Hpha_TRINITY_DN4904_c0_g1::TRINITY_DN4904_c0_g1_i1::g.51499::m.51499
MLALRRTAAVAARPRVRRGAWQRCWAASSGPDDRLHEPPPRHEFSERHLAKKEAPDSSANLVKFGKVLATGILFYAAAYGAFELKKPGSGSNMAEGFGLVGLAVGLHFVNRPAVQL